MPQFHSAAADAAGEGLDVFTRSYIAAAYWTDTGDDEQPDSETPMAVESIVAAKLDCAHFQQHVGAWLELAYAEGYTPEQAGIDFWLTRNHHGSGFWDRGLECGERLTEATDDYGSCDLYEGDDGLLYLE